MNTILWFIRFGLYMIGTLVKYLKLKNIKRKCSRDEIDKYTYSVAKKWAKYVLNSSKTKIEIIGRENLPESNCLFVANHQGYLDIPIFLGELDKPLGFIAKKELEKVPILSDWMREIHCVFMDRHNIRESIKSINEGIEILKDGYSMVIFPEGTRSKSLKIGEFKKGSLKLGIKANVPIVPVTIIGSYKAFEEYGAIKSSYVKVIIDKPIHIYELTKDKQTNLSQIVYSIIKNNLEKFK